MKSWLRIHWKATTAKFNGLQAQGKKVGLTVSMISLAESEC